VGLSGLSSATAAHDQHDAQSEADQDFAEHDEYLLHRGGSAASDPLPVQTLPVAGLFPRCEDGDQSTVTFTIIAAVWARWVLLWLLEQRW
jgi:hypothetical protein